MQPRVSWFETCNCGDVFYTNIGEAFIFTFTFMNEGRFECIFERILRMLYLSVDHAMSMVMWHQFAARIQHKKRGFFKGRNLDWKWFQTCK
jgi:hypothetical protein